MQDRVRRENSLVIGLVLLGDLAIINLLYALLIFIKGDSLTNIHVLQTMCTGTIIYLVCTMQGGVILHKGNVRGFNVVSRVFRNVVIYAVVSSLIFFIGRFYIMPFYVRFLFWIALVLFISYYRLQVRYFLNLYRSKEKNVKKVVFVGSYYSIFRLYDEINTAVSKGYKVEGYFDDKPNEQFQQKGCSYLGNPAMVVDWLVAHPDVCEVYCSLPSVRKDDILPIIAHCTRSFVRFYSVPDVSNYCHRRMHLNIMGRVPYLSLYREPLLYSENRMAKRLFDIVFSLLIICTIFPITLIVVCIMTTLTMPGPIFFMQRRNGINGKEFTCIKFRSMRCNNEADTLQATADDPRKTWWGNIMRRTNIDEVPQFINVLLGQMSVVGPRPHMVNQNIEYSGYIQDYPVRHMVKPGITGWSQVNGFRGATEQISLMEERVNHDIWYIEHWSFSLDMYIIYKTIVNMFTGDKNAY